MHNVPKLVYSPVSRLAVGICAGSVPSAIGAHYGGNYESVEQKNGGSEDEQKTFHSGFSF
jgi:hypothetical protein